MSRVSFCGITLIPNFMKIRQLVCNLKRWGDMCMSARAHTHTRTRKHPLTHTNMESVTFQLVHVGRKGLINTQLLHFWRIKFFLRCEACLNSKEIHIKRILQITLSIILIQWRSLHWNSDSFSKRNQIGRAVEYLYPYPFTLTPYALTSFRNTSIKWK